MPKRKGLSDEEIWDSVKRRPGRPRKITEKEDQLVRF
jgi:hypothetical protein